MKRILSIYLPILSFSSFSSEIVLDNNNSLNIDTSRNIESPKVYEKQNRKNKEIIAETTVPVETIDLYPELYVKEGNKLKSKIITLDKIKEQQNEAIISIKQINNNIDNKTKRIETIINDIKKTSETNHNILQKGKDNYVLIPVDNSKFEFLSKKIDMINNKILKQDTVKKLKAIKIKHFGIKLLPFISVKNNLGTSEKITSLAIENNFGISNIFSFDNNNIGLEVFNVSGISNSTASSAPQYKVLDEIYGIRGTFSTSYKNWEIGGGLSMNFIGTRQNSNDDNTYSLELGTNYWVGWVPASFIKFKVDYSSMKSLSGVGIETEYLF